MDGNELLQKVDGYRKMSNSFSLKIKISDYNDVKLKEEAVFFGCFKGNNKSVMICTKGKNKNMKVLMKDENMWVNIGRSKRAMRITPMQRLLGQASNGDVAKVAFSQDYNGEIKKITNDFYILELDAKNNGATYQKIILYVKK
ncbi:MAG: outer membrane lipoprotein-sorting protein, partial [Calditrichia bacterium]|nr:outer membrane lipoprotein-sorting protein [Calditrichia bacterium]